MEQAESRIESPAQTAQKVEDKVEASPEAKKAEKVIKETAKVLVTAEGREKEALSEAAQEAMNPEQQGVTPTRAEEHQREYLRKAVIKRLKPLDAVDTNLFLAINHLPHTHVLNGLFCTCTTIFNVVALGYGEMGIMAMRDR